MRSVGFGLLVALAACGENGGKGDPDGGSLRYFPLSVGASWTYLVTDTSSSATKEKSTTVEDYEDIGDDKNGVMAYRIRTDKLTGETVSWQRVNGTVLERHREQSFDDGLMTTEEYYEPFKLRLDERASRIELGATWLEDYTESAVDYEAGGEQSTNIKSDEWLVEAVDEEIEVPAGAFTCLRLRRENTGNNAVKTYWFAKDVGKVREEGEGQTEELTDFDLD